MPEPAPRSNIWDRILALTVLVTAIFGAMLLVLPEQTRALFDVIAFPAGDSPVAQPVASYVGFVYGVLGAVMVGWAAILMAVVRGPLLHRQAWAWWAVAGSVGGWYLVDTAHSLGSGYPGNAILNTVFACGFAVPLVMLRKEVATRS